jgi:hypothetical protein
LPLTREAARVLGGHRLRYGDLIGVAAHGADFLGKRLLQVIGAEPRAPFAGALVEAYGRVPEDEHQAVAAMLLLFGRFGVAGKQAPLAPEDKVPLLEILEGGGPDGVWFGAMLLGIAERSAGLPRARRTEQAILRALDGILEPAEFTLLVPALVDEPAIDHLAPPKTSAKQIDGVTRVGAMLPARTMRTEDLLHTLSYGGGDVLALVEAEQTRHPRSALGLGLAARGRNPPATDPAAEHAARLLRVLDMFRSPHDPKTIELARFAATYGETGVRIAQLLGEGKKRTAPEAPNYNFCAGVVQALASLLGAEKALPLVDRLVRNDRLIPQRVPALDEALKMVPPEHFRGRGLVAIQHLFPTTIALFEAFLARGMRASDIHVLGTPYASNPLVAAYARLKGMNVSPARDKAGATRSFEEHRTAEILSFMVSISVLGRRPPNGWVALDDGGMLHSLIHGEKKDPRGWSTDPALWEPIAELFNAPIHGVEQTTRGLTELAGADLSYPVIKVADAPGKIEEGKIIGWDLAASLLRELNWRERTDVVHKLGVVSAGTVGLETATFLRDAHNEVQTALEVEAQMNI